MKLFTLSKQERLSHLNEINKLFKEGIAFNVSPLRIVYHISPSATREIKIMASVPRRKFKKAVTRNRIKRLIREAYRHNKPDINTFPGSMHVGFIFIGENENVKQSEIDKAMISGIKRLLNDINHLSTLQ